MIEIKDLKRLALKRGIKQLGYAEKDYILDLMLYALSNSVKNELIFKGGTCLAKLYNLRRFSEDLDFSISTQDTDIPLSSIIKKMIQILKRFGIEGKLVSDKVVYNSHLLTFHFLGPIAAGKNSPVCSVRMDINLKSNNQLEPNLKNYKSIYPDIPSFTLLSMQSTEIAAEKIRAIYTRDKARDIFDLYFLFRTDIHPSLDLINMKLNYYDLKFDRNVFIQKLMKKEGLWQKELERIIFDILPDFQEVYQVIENNISNLS